MSQRCHLGYDADDHARHAAATRRRRRVAAGQGELAIRRLAEREGVR